MKHRLMGLLNDLRTLCTRYGFSIYTLRDIQIAHV